MDRQRGVCGEGGGGGEAGARTSYNMCRLFGGSSGHEGRS